MPFIVGAGLIVSACLEVAHVPHADGFLASVLVICTIPYVLRMMNDIRQGHFGVDIIALLAILSAFSLDQLLPGAVILFMLSGGEALEEYALARARLQLTQLLSRAPSVAHLQKNGTLHDIPVSHVSVGDVLVVKPKETIPVDGAIIEGHSSIDESMITGEPLPVEKGPSDQISSGSINTGDVLVIKTLRESRHSKYEQIVRLVHQAETQKAPMVRLADRYSGWFTVVTLLLSGAAWAFSHNPLLALAVLVVATPCPLIIATPVAVMSGISLAASRGIVVKNGGALETLSRVRAFVFDKTGTITFGEPSVSRIIPESLSESETLRIAASLDQLSAHVLARSLVKEAKARGLKIVMPSHFHEKIAEGVTGTIDGREYALGKKNFVETMGASVPEYVIKLHEKHRGLGEKMIFLFSKKEFLGAIAFADRIRHETTQVFKNIHDSGVESLTLLSGDKTVAVKEIAKAVGIKKALGDLKPEGKVAELQKIRKTIFPVAMVGDGINDAPILAAADVGIAMGSHGATVASETADIVIAVDTLSRVYEALQISKRMVHVAEQGIYFGIGVSVLLMVIAAFGYIPPVWGAIIQEMLDITVILNALRVHQRKGRANV